MADATPRGADPSTNPRPCSTCSSTKAPTRRRTSSSRPRCPGSVPAADIPSALVLPSAPVSPRAPRAGGGPAGRVGGEGAGEQRGAGGGDAEAGALLVTEAGDAHGPPERG